MIEPSSVKFTVPGEPVGKGRPRFTRGGHAYTPEKNMTAYFSIPKSFSKKRHKLAEEQLIRPTKKPDTDNLAKCKDALNGIAWKDDSQVVTEHIYKFYSDRPRLEIEIYKWEAGK